MMIWQFLARFAIGGLLVALAPIVGSRLGAQYAGLALLFPIVTLTGFVFVWVRSGPDMMRDASVGALKGVPAVAIFLAAVYVSSRLGSPPVVCLAIGVVFWLATATALIALQWLK